MAKKDAAAKKAAAVAAAAKGSAVSQSGSSAKKPSGSKASNRLTHSLNDVVAAVQATYNNYLKTLTPRLKLIDSFLAFLVSLGALQFVYVLLVGNYPFNAFLGSFIACVGQFVLTVSLRMQYAPANTDPAVEESSASVSFASISAERAFGDYIFASLILHFIVIHFIN